MSLTGPHASVTGYRLVAYSRAYYNWHTISHGSF